MHCCLTIIGHCDYKILICFLNTRDFKRYGQFSTEYHNKKEISSSNIIPYCLFSSFRLSHDDPHRILGEWIIGSFSEGITIVFHAIIINIILIVASFEHPPIKSFVCHSPWISLAVRSGHINSELLCPFLFYMVR